jgi:hypothetical protein
VFRKISYAELVRQNQLIQELPFPEIPKAEIHVFCVQLFVLSRMIAGDSAFAIAA